MVHTRASTLKINDKAKVNPLDVKVEEGASLDLTLCLFDLVR